MTTEVILERRLGEREPKAQTEISIANVAKVLSNPPRVLAFQYKAGGL